MSQVLVIPGGDPVTADRIEPFGPFDVVIAADSGAGHARALGVQPDIVIGDFDSIDEATLDAMADARLVPHPRDKDDTDLELALALAIGECGADRIVVGGGGGGRLDHLLGNAAVIGAAAARNIVWVLRQEIVYPVAGARQIAAAPGSTVSLVAWGPAAGVTTSGLRWGLADEALDHHRGRGISNIAESSTIDVRVDEGVVLVILNG